MSASHPQKPITGPLLAGSTAKVCKSLRVCKRRGEREVRSPDIPDAAEADGCLSPCCASLARGLRTAMRLRRYIGEENEYDAHTTGCAIAYPHGYYRDASSGASISIYPLRGHYCKPINSDTQKKILLPQFLILPVIWKTHC